MLASNKSTDDGTPTTRPPIFGGNFRLQVLSAKERNLELLISLGNARPSARRSRTKNHLPPRSLHRHTSLSKATTERDTTIMADEAPPEIPEVCLFCLVCVKE
jgi:hypothetical protein